MARPVEVEVVAEVLVVTRVVAERVVAGIVVAGMVVPGMVVWLLVVPGMVVAGSVVADSVVADSTVVWVVVVAMVVVKVVSLLVVPVVAVLVSLEATEEASERMLLATDEASERMLEAMALPEAIADETAADTEEIRGPWAMASPDRRPRAATTKVWGFMVNDWMLFFVWCRWKKREEEKEECEWTLGERMTYMLVFIYMYIYGPRGSKGR
ncbi:hypothetical protein J3E69DRAFT_348674 [Trichoderma sp. SZMC 28015]